MARRQTQWEGKRSGRAVARAVGGRGGHQALALGSVWKAEPPRPTGRVDVEEEGVRMPPGFEWVVTPEVRS